MIERTDSTAGVSRRRVLGTVTGAAVSGVAGVPTAVVGDSGRKKRITTLASGDESRETVSVSQRWYRHKERAIQVKQALTEQYSGRGGIHSVGIETNETTVGNLHGKRVYVAASSDGDVSVLDDVPSSVDGVPVRTAREERPGKTDCYNDQREDVDGDSENEYLGGMAFEGMKNLNSDPETVQSGTLCCRVYYNNTRYMLTSRHVISGGVCNVPGITGDSYGWGRSGDDDQTEYLGDVEAVFTKYDAALLSIRFPKYDDISNRIVGESNAEVVGRVTGDGIDVLQSEPAGKTYKRGRTTCKQSGTIQKARIHFDTGCFFDEEPQEELRQVRTSATQKDGDSGGVGYVRRNDSSGPDDLYVLHMTTRATVNDNEAQGSSAQVMHERNGFSFGYDPFY